MAMGSRRCQRRKVPVECRIFGKMRRRRRRTRRRKPVVPARERRNALSLRLGIWPALSYRWRRSAVQLPFTKEQFFDLLAAYNGGLWPALLALWIASVLVCVLLLSSRPPPDRWISAL